MSGKNKHFPLLCGEHFQIVHGMQIVVLHFSKELYKKSEYVVT